MKRFIEAEGGFHLRDDFGGGFGRHEHVDGVARDNMHKAEDDQGDPEQNGDGLEESTYGEDEHGGVISGSCRAMLHRSMIA